MTTKSKWQQEFDALPEWARELVRAAAGVCGHGGGSEHLLSGYASEDRAKRQVFHVVLKNDVATEWHDGFWGMLDLARALTAPWPPPTYEEACKVAGNDQPQIVEMLAGGEDCAFDQPCAFGHRVESHAVYCHNAAWPNSPRKCRRDRDEYKHEDCPGFVANKNYSPIV